MPTNICYLGVVIVGGSEACVNVFIAEDLLYLLFKGLNLLIPHVDEV